MELQTEKEKAKYVHNLELRRLIVDKLLFGAVVVLIGGIANLLIENYKNDLSKERFIVERQYEATSKIKAAYEEMHSLWAYYTLNDTKLTDNLNLQYREKIKQFDDTANLWNIVLPRSFEKNLNYFLWLHGGIEAKGIDSYLSMKPEELYKHQIFMGEVKDLFYNLAREAIGIIDTDVEVFGVLKELSYAEAAAVGSIEYYDLCFQEWEKKYIEQNH